MTGICIPLLYDQLVAAHAEPIETFQRSCRRRSHRNHRSPRLYSVPKPLDEGPADFDKLRVHDMPAERRRFHRQKSTRTYMQGNEIPADPPRLQTPEDRLGKMQ